MSTKLDQTQHDAAVLPRIRDLAAASVSLRQIASQLETDGFPTPGGQRHWSYVAVKRILDRAETLAERSLESTPGSHHPPLTVTVTGPVTTHGPMAISGGEVTIKVCAAPTLDPETEARTDAAVNDPPDGRLIELAALGGVFTFPPGFLLNEYRGPGLLGPAYPPGPALHAALYLRRDPR